jgi:hypothetical protein
MTHFRQGVGVLKNNLCGVEKRIAYKIVIRWKQVITSSPAIPSEYMYLADFPCILNLAVLRIAVMRVYG